MLFVVRFLFHLLESSCLEFVITLGVKRRSRSSLSPLESRASISGWQLQFAIFLRSGLSVVVFFIVLFAPVQKLIPNCPRKERVIPLRQFGVFEQVELRHLLFGNLNVGWVVPGI